MIHPSATQFTEAMTHAGFASCNEDRRYDVPGCSGICTEVETLALLFGFVRTLRPKVVVETGCNVGCASQVLVSALKANGGDGFLYTCDIDQVFTASVWSRCYNPGDTIHRIDVWQCEGLKLVQEFAANADLYFIDSSDESRMAELEHLRAHGKKGAVVLVHDTALYPHVRELVETFARHVVLPGPRGLGIITL